MHDPNDIREAVSLLSPGQRRDLENAALESAARRADAREEPLDPVGFQQRKAHAGEVAAAILGDEGTVPPAAVEAVRTAWGLTVRADLAEENG